MSVKKYPTHFAPGNRTTDDILSQQKQTFVDTPMLGGLYDAVNEIVIILNAQRQIVYYNQALIDCLDLNDPDALYGLRPGEALNCRNASTEPGGCGTSDLCRTCGAVNAILSSQAQKPTVKECRILQADGGDALEFLVRATPLILDGQEYTIFAATDISHEKRRQALERIFFHDLMNTAAGLEILAKLLNTGNPEQLEELREQMAQGVRLLLEQIRTQRDLAAAENGELEVRRDSVTSKAILRSVMNVWDLHLHSAAQTYRLALDPDSPDVTFTSDATLLLRILHNMVKNAVEASPDGATITLGCSNGNQHLELWVHNPTVMSSDIQAQVFQRSFSTKGIGRGLGTYSMKLLGERYLQAQVSFTSFEGEGTVFKIRCPLSL